MLMRPPVAFKNNSSDPNNNGFWGSHDRGSGIVAPATTGATVTATVKTLFTGKQTNVAYVDGHTKNAKLAPTKRTSNTTAMPASSRHRTLDFYLSAVAPTAGPARQGRERTCARGRWGS